MKPSEELSLMFSIRPTSNSVAVIAILLLGGSAGLLDRSEAQQPGLKEERVKEEWLRSARSGPWSSLATWEGGKVPGAGARVQIRTGHTVVYDQKSDQAIRAIHVAGTLTFARDRDTRLDVGLIRIGSGDEPSEKGFDCEAHVAPPEDGKPRPALEVGTPDRPIPAKYQALIRLVYFEGMDRESCPAIVCCGGRFEDNEAHCQRRHAFNLGGGVPFGKPNVDGVGPDVTHPFIIRNMKIWNVHWAFHAVSPSVLVDGMEIYGSEYALWRSVYKDHAYRKVHLDEISVHKEFAAEGKTPRESDYPGPLAPVDDLPPATVITHVKEADGGELVVRGTTTDNGTVKKVVVNGQAARAVDANFARWEVVLARPASGKITLTASAEDAAGNVEKIPHRMDVILGK